MDEVVEERLTTMLNEFVVVIGGVGELLNDSEIVELSVRVPLGSTVTVYVVVELLLRETVLL